MIQQILDFITKIDWGVIIGIIALLFTAISLQVQRKHNRLSIKPIAIISVGDYENQLAVYLQNKGTGPLIIENLSIALDNDRKEKAIIDFFDSNFKNVVWSTYVANIDGWAILPGESRTLIKLDGNPTDENFICIRDNIRKVLASLQVELQYKDIYENRMPKKIRKLDFFARNIIQEKEMANVKH
jgi:hypothetical protein